MSGGLAPSKSTLYVGNLPFSLTNNDLHKIFEKYGKVVKITIVKDKQTRKSKGVAFVLFLSREDAYKCVQSLNNTPMFGRTIKCSIAKDNGRASDFIRRKEYFDKTSCYECGEFGHVSYKCPKNLFGEREPPPKKVRKRRRKPDDEVDIENEEVTSDEGEDPSLDSLASAIRYQQLKVDEEKVVTSDNHYKLNEASSSGKKYKKDAYFSDEEEVDD